MAAILTPNRSAKPSTPPRRPALRLVDTSEGLLRPPVAVRPARRSIAAELGLDSAALLMVSIAFLIVVGGVIALGQGRFSDLAADPTPAATPAAASAAPAPAASPGTMVTVRSGDSMWSIARRLQPTGDVRSLVDALVAANGGSSIAPGDRLTVPR